MLIDHEKFMQAALREAARGGQKGEVPIGAIALYKGRVVGRAHNIREKSHDPTGHAEILLLRKVSKKLKSWRMPGLSVYVTLEPCLMCLSAMQQAQVSQVIFAAPDPKKDSSFHRMEIIGGVSSRESAELIRHFFKKLRLKKK
ncbi:MAG: nucleoside deaminase [Deltaproteobacteria bacterium]|nr:nucleoside deaminase [Deltaproteobacteria bacterium]